MMILIFIIFEILQYGQSSTSNTAPIYNNPYEYLKATPELSKIFDLIDAHPKVVNKLKYGRDITFFAPVNEAIVERNHDSVGISIEDILFYHIVTGSVMTPVKGKSFITETELVKENTGDEKNIQLQLMKINSIDDDHLTIDFGVKISAVSISSTMTKSGVVHTIDLMLLPPSNIVSFAHDYGITNMAEVIQSSKMQDELSNPSSITIFLWDYDVTKSYLTSKHTIEEVKTLLRGHAVIGVHFLNPPIYEAELENMNGDKLKVVCKDNDCTVNNIKITQINNLLKNGMVHIIESIIKFEKTGGVDPPISTPTPEPQPSQEPNRKLDPPPDNIGNSFSLNIFVLFFILVEFCFFFL